MSKITLSNVGSLTDSTTAQNTINNNFAIIQTASDNTLSRDGTAPNPMGSNLDMNSNQIINLPAPATANSALRLSDLSSFVGGGIVTNIPAGGTTGQVLAKVNNTDYNVAWTAESALLTAGTNIVLTGTTPTTISTTLTPTFTGTNVSSLNVSGLTASSAVATDGSKNLLSVTNTGTGSNVLATSPSLVTPSLDIPTSGTLTNCTGLPISTGVSGLAAGVSTFLATPSSANLKSAVTDETGSGGALVFATGPTLSAPVISTISNTGTLTLPTSTDTLVGKATTDTFTNKTFDSGGTGNSFSISGVATSRGQYPGETTTGSATAGNIGEYVESVIASGSATSLTTGTAKTITSISLTAGDWDVSGNISYNGAGGASVTLLEQSLSLSTNTVDQTAGRNSQFSMAAVVPGVSPGWSIPVGPHRFSLSGTTSVFLVSNQTFTVGTLAGWGIIRARRIR